jgi:hypothetical protein
MLVDIDVFVSMCPPLRRTSLELSIDKIRTYRTQTPYTFFGHKAFTAISYPGDGTKSQPTGNWMRLPMIERSLMYIVRLPFL